MAKPAEPQHRKVKSGFLFLGAGILAALASLGCCLGPLLLALLGVGGAWMGTAFGKLETFRPLLLGAAFLSLVLAYWRFFRSGSCPAEGAEGGECGNLAPWARILFWTLAAAVFLAAVFPWILALWE
jgi:mercuric ion transport protein